MTIPASLYIHSASVQRRTVTADAQGGFTDSRVVVSSALACRVSSKRKLPRERSEAGKVQGIGDYKIFTAAGVDVELDDYFVISGDTYEIVGVLRPSTGHHLEWEAELVEDGR